MRLYFSSACSGVPLANLNAYGAKLRTLETILGVKFLASHLDLMGKFNDNIPLHRKMAMTISCCMLSTCEGMVYVKPEGEELSSGVEMECTYARCVDIPVFSVPPETWKWEEKLRGVIHAIPRLK